MPPDSSGSAWREAQPSLDELLEGVRAWVQIESPTDDPDGMRRMADRVEADYAPFAHVERIPGRDGCGDHLLATWPPDGVERPGAMGLLILSHIDTVQPLGTLERLPWRVEGGCAWGPGAEDMKGGAFIALAAVRELARRGVRPPTVVRHLLTSDEETGSLTSRARIEAEARRAHHVLVTEPARSGGKIVLARKGVGHFRLDVHGRAAHAGVEHELGRSAVRELARQVLAVEGFTDYARGVTVNVGRIEGGTRSNVVPEHAFALVDVRVPDAAAGEALAARFAALRAHDPDVELVVTGEIDRPGYETDARIARLFEHARGIARGIGFELEGLKTGGGSDGNFTAAIAPTLDGLGVDGDGGHTPEERLYVDSVVPRMRLLMGLIETLAPGVA